MTYSFVKKDAPRYTRGHAMGIAALGISAAACCAYYVAVKRENARREKGISRCSEDMMSEKLSEGQRAKLGDLRAEYRYFT